MDEARFALKVWHRRRWCPRGFRPPWIHQDSYEWLWLYVALESATGESFCLYLPRLDGECFEIFLRELNRREIGGQSLLQLHGIIASVEDEQGHGVAFALALALAFASFVAGGWQSSRAFTCSTATSLTFSTGLRGLASTGATQLSRAKPIWAIH
jgi:hypothetical protein